MTEQIQQFDFSVDLLKALLWQYDNAPNLQGLLAYREQFYVTNQKEFWENWIRDVFDLRTANDFGLQVWSIILGQPIFTSNPPSGLEEVFGFDAANLNFDNGNFGSSFGYTYRLPTESARLLLRLRYFQLTSSGTIPEINRMLKYLFGDAGTAYLIDNHDMTQTYYFSFAFTSELQYIFSNFDILPRPAGVKSEITNGTELFFGFGENNENFDNGSFRG